MHNETTPTLVPSAAVCSTLKIERSTLTRMVKDGRIAPAFKMPGKRGGYLFDPVEVDRVLSERTTAA